MLSGVLSGIVPGLLSIVLSTIVRAIYKVVFLYSFLLPLFGPRSTGLVTRGTGLVKYLRQRCSVGVGLLFTQGASTFSNCLIWFRAVVEEVMWGGKLVRAGWVRYIGAVWLRAK